MRVQTTYRVTITYDVPGDRRNRVATVRASSTFRAVQALSDKLGRTVPGYKYVTGSAVIK